MSTKLQEQEDKLREHDILFEQHEENLQKLYNMFKQLEDRQRKQDITIEHQEAQLNEQAIINRNQAKTIMEQNAKIQQQGEHLEHLQMSTSH